VEIKENMSKEEKESRMNISEETKLLLNNLNVKPTDEVLSYIFEFAEAILQKNKEFIIKMIDGI
jgi:uncharacterized protein YpuA (DUF1002 family)